MFYEKCKEILLKQIELIMEATVMQDKIRLAVLNREWEGFDNNISVIYGIEKKLSFLENEREEIFAAFETMNQITSIKADDINVKSRFYSIACKLPETQRNELTEIYRSLKMETMKLRIANEDYMSYLAGIRTMIKDFFDIAFPERGGKIYTPQGTHLSHDMSSMMLNQSF
jgi:hypothetical protein